MDQLWTEAERKHETYHGHQSSKSWRKAASPRARTEDSEGFHKKSNLKILGARGCWCGNVMLLECFFDLIKQAVRDKSGVMTMAKGSANRDDHSLQQDWGLEWGEDSALMQDGKGGIEILPEEWCIAILEEPQCRMPDAIIDDASQGGDTLIDPGVVLLIKVDQGKALRRYRWVLEEVQAMARWGAEG